MTTKGHTYLKKPSGFVSVYDILLPPGIKKLICVVIKVKNIFGGPFNEERNIVLVDWKNSEAAFAAFRHLDKYKLQLPQETLFMLNVWYALPGDTGFTQFCQDLSAEVAADKKRNMRERHTRSPPPSYTESERLHRQTGSQLPQTPPCYGIQAPCNNAILSPTPTVAPLTPIAVPVVSRPPFLIPIPSSPPPLALGQCILTAVTQINPLMRPRLMHPFVNRGCHPSTLNINTPRPMVPSNLLCVRPPAALPNDLTPNVTNFTDKEPENGPDHDNKNENSITTKQEDQLKESSYTTQNEDVTETKHVTENWEKTRKMGVVNNKDVINTSDAYSKVALNKLSRREAENKKSTVGLKKEHVDVKHEVNTQNLETTTDKNCRLYPNIDNEFESKFDEADKDRDKTHFSVNKGQESRAELPPFTDTNQNEIGDKVYHENGLYENQHHVKTYHVGTTIPRQISSFEKKIFHPAWTNGIKTSKRWSKNKKVRQVYKMGVANGAAKDKGSEPLKQIEGKRKDEVKLDQSTFQKDVNLSPIKEVEENMDLSVKSPRKHHVAEDTDPEKRNRKETHNAIGPSMQPETGFTDSIPVIDTAKNEKAICELYKETDRQNEQTLSRKSESIIDALASMTILNVMQSKEMPSPTIVFDYRAPIDENDYDNIEHSPLMNYYLKKGTAKPYKSTEMFKTLF